MANGLGKMPSNILDVKMAKTDSIKWRTHMQINSQLAKNMHDNDIDHFNQQLDISNEIYYSTEAGQQEEKAFMVDLPAIF